MSSLFVDRKNVHLELESGAIVFRENGERIGTVPLAPLTRVFLRGDVRLSASLLGQLGERGIGVVILSGRRGEPTLLMARPHNDARRRVEQIRRSFDPAECLRLAIGWIQRKTQHQIQWFDELRAHDMQARYELTHAVRLLTAQHGRLGGAANLASLRGIEGTAGRIYFEGLRAVVPASLGFKERNRRPPRDPFNALLSLSYTLAQAETALALHGCGLDPCVGFFHQLDFGRESLACDVLEPLRPLLDRMCLSLVRQQVLTADHFSTTQAGCMLGKAGRARYYAAYEEQSEAMRQMLQREVQQLASDIGQPVEAVAMEASDVGEQPS